MDMVVDNTTYQLRNTTICAPDKNNAFYFTLLFLACYTTQIEEKSRVNFILWWMARRRYSTEERALAHLFSRLALY